MAHAEEHLALAGSLLINKQHPWLAVWTVPNDKDPTWRIVPAVAIDNPSVSHYSLDDPSCPLSGELRGTHGTTNHKREGVSVFALYTYLFNRSLWPDARQRLIDVTAYQLNTAMWSMPASVKNGGGPISEFPGPSHPQWHLAADAVARWIAIESNDKTLLDLTSELWFQLLNFMLITSSNGRAYWAGPRATRKFGKQDKEAEIRQGTNACVNAIVCEAFYPTLRWSDPKLRGADMLAAAVFRKLGVKSMTSMSQWMSYDSLEDLAKSVDALNPDYLPKCVDPVVVARSATNDQADVACWVDLPNNVQGHNPTDPGYQWSAARIGGQEYFTVEPGNDQPHLGFLPRGHSSHPKNLRNWPYRWELRHPTSSGYWKPESTPQVPTRPQPNEPAGPSEHPAPAQPALSSHASSLRSLAAKFRTVADRRPAARGQLLPLIDELDRIVASMSATTEAVD